MTICAAGLCAWVQIDLVLKKVILTHPPRHTTTPGMGHMHVAMQSSDI